MRHPRALYLLFATEMWERLSYYGMRALLVLYMTDHLRGGLGFDDARALRTYAAYTLGVYVTPLLGGWLADRVLGQRYAVLAGASLMMAGHFLMAVPGLAAFYGALAFLVSGNGLFKPNISSLVGGLYREGDPQREAGFTFFYMGINTGALLAPLVVGTLGEKLGWHVGFGAAGVGMAIGLTAFATLGPRLLGTAGLHRPESGASIPVQPLTREERHRLWVLVLLTSFAILFWAGFEQAGGLVNLFTARSVDRHLFGWEIPVTWFQGAEPAFVVLLGPLFAALWTRLAGRPGGGPSTPLKVASGLLWMAVGLVPLIIAAHVAMGGRLASLGWILGYYFISTLGELSLSPVALSAVTRFAPQRLVSRMMGVWLVSLGAGSYLAGYLGSQVQRLGLLPLYQAVGGALAVAGLLLAVLSPLLRRMTHGADAFTEQVHD